MLPSFVKSSIWLLLCLTLALSVSATRMRFTGNEFVDMSLRKLAQVADTVGNSTVNGTAGVDSTFLFLDSPRTAITNPSGYENAIGMVATYNPTGGFGRCTGALVTQTTVLTAAHCFFDGTSRSPAALNRIRFFPGISRAADGSLNSRYGNPQRGAGQGIGATFLHIHPTYQQAINQNPGSFADVNVRNDLALIHLDRPVDIEEWFGLATSCQVRADDNGVVQDFRGIATAGYPRDTDAGVLAKSTCDVPARLDNNCVDKRFDHQCSILGGNSGGPIFAEFREADGRTLSYIFAVQSSEGGANGCATDATRSGAAFANTNACRNSGAEINDVELKRILAWIEEDGSQRPI